MKRRDFMRAGAYGASAFFLDLTLPQWARAAQGGVLNIVVQPEPPGLMLGMVQNGPTQLVSGNIFEGLLRYDEKLNPMPGLATKWEQAADGLSYTFTLKQGVTWHDGKPFTAQDVVFSATKFLPEVHARFRANMTHVDSVTAPDDYTVVFKLKAPVGPFLGIFEVGSMPITPRHLYEGTDYRNNPANNAPIGTGAFAFKEWKRGEYIHLVKNPGYHEPGLPHVDEVYFQIIPDAASRAAAFETGKIDILPGGSVEYFDVPRLSKLPKVQVTSKGWEFFAPHALMWVNNKNPALADKRVRKAILHALNRQAMVDVVLQGYGKVALGPFNSAIKFFSDKVEKYPYDPKKAQDLLKAAGYKGEKLVMLPLPYGETWQRIAEMAKQNLVKAGFNIDLQALDIATRNKRVESRDFDLTFTYLYEYGDPELGVARNYVSSSIANGSLYNNVASYSNPEVDKLFAAGAVASDPAKRGEIYAQVQKILVDDAPVAWLFEMFFPTIYHDRVSNVVNSGIGVNDGLARTQFV